MALNSPLFGKRDESFNPRSPQTSGGAAATPSPVANASPLGGSALAGTVASPAGAASLVQESGAKLTVGPNIKLRGVEITDCDTLVVEGTVEATMDSRVMQIAQQGTFKGAATIDIAEIRGTFEGDITAREKLVIFSTGKVTGKVRYGKLVIEEGGQVSGEISSDTKAKFASEKVVAKADDEASPKIEVKAAA